MIQGKMHYLPYDDVKFVFVLDYYDLPLKATCRYQGRLCLAVLEDWQADDANYFVYELDWKEKLKYKYLQRKWEFISGTDWSRSEAWIINDRLPKWFTKRLWRFYFDLQRKKINDKRRSG